MTPSFRSPNAAPLQGTECARNKFCYNGECVSQISQDKSQSSITEQIGDPTYPTFPPKIQKQQMTICDFFERMGIRFAPCVNSG